MRIVAGKYKGRRIETANDSAALRPTSQRVREAIFSSILHMFDLENSFVIDLYAGSGAFGLEALSRGARYAVFVESNSRTARGISENLVRFDATSMSTVLCKPVERCWQCLTQIVDKKALTSSEHRVLIFADPPYNQSVGELLLASIDRVGLVAKDSLVVIESSAMDAVVVSKAPSFSLNYLKSKNYGDTAVHYFHNSEKPRTNNHLY